MTILPSVTSPINRVSFFTFTFYLQHFHPHILSFSLHLLHCSSLFFIFFIHFISLYHKIHTKMAGSHETNPVTKQHSSSKKHKSKSGKSSHKHYGKSGHRDEHRVEHQEHHETSGQTHGQTEQVQEQPGHSERVHEQPEQIEQQQAKRKGKKVQFAEEPSSKRQRVEEDDPTIYRDGALEPVSSKFETIKPYFNQGLFIDLDKIDDLGFPHLRPFLEKYMPWLGINQSYNINVLRVFCQSLTGKAKYKKIDGKEQIRRLSFTATVRGRTFSFT